MAASLVIGRAAPAAAESIEHRPEGVHDHELIADNFWGERERETEYTEPPGYYIEGVGGGGDGTYEYTEECERGTIFSGCEGLHTLIDQNSEGTLPSGFVKREHLEIETDYMGRRTVTNYRYGWKPEAGAEAEGYGDGNPGEPHRPKCLVKDPVDCATGNQVVTQTNLAVAGRGPALGVSLTYNSRLAAKQPAAGPFGFGWTGPYSAHLELNLEGKEATSTRTTAARSRSRATK